MPGTTSDTAATLFKSAQAFETCLKKHHATSDGLWLKIAKKGASESSITYPEAVEIALCWDWIDGQKKALDDEHFLQRFSPRRARSIWSRINVNKVAALIEAGRMQPTGQSQIDAAMADGRWDKAYVASAHVLAITHPKAAGERFLLSNGRPLAMKEIGAIVKSAFGHTAVRVQSRSIPNIVLRTVSLFNAELRPLIPDLGYAKKTSNEKARQLLDWQPREAREAIVAAAQSMAGVSRQAA